MSFKQLAQISLAILLSVTSGIFVRESFRQDSCNRAALDNVLDGGHLILDADCVLLVSPAVVVTGDVIIEGGILHSNGFDRVLIVNEGGNLILRDTAVLSGSVEIEPAYGGAVYNSGVLRLENTRIVANSAERGGGIYNEGHLVLVDSEIARNRAREGGGIYNAGTFVIEASNILENSAYSDGEYGGYGAGIVNEGLGAVVFAIIANNRGDGQGIGIHSSGNLIVRDSVIMDNQCTVRHCRGTGILRSDGLINARKNYWGSADGPGEEGSGSGDGVIGLDVDDYTPYLREIPLWVE